MNKNTDMKKVFDYMQTGIYVAEMIADPIYDNTYTGKVFLGEYEDERELRFKFRFVWRGVWEGRIYFPDDEEYWHEQLREMYLVWEEISFMMRCALRNTDPTYPWSEGVDDLWKADKARIERGGKP